MHLDNVHGFDCDDDDKGDEKKDNGGAFMQKLLESRTIIASKGVDDELARNVIAQLFVLEQDDETKPITVIVNSPGGSADSGFAIHDAMKFVKCPVRSIVMGMAASAGVMIALGADKGQRFITPNSRFMLHQPSIRTMGQASDLEIVSTEINRIKLQYNQIVSDCTGKSVEEVEKDVSRDFWLPAQASLDYGLVDKVITERGELD